MDIDKWLCEFIQYGNNVEHKPITGNTRRINLHSLSLGIRHQNLCKPIQHSPLPLHPRPDNKVTNPKEVRLILPQSLLHRIRHGLTVAWAHMFWIAEEFLGGARGERGEGEKVAQKGGPFQSCA